MLCMRGSRQSHHKINQLSSCNDFGREVFMHLHIFRAKSARKHSIFNPKLGFAVSLLCSGKSSIESRNNSWLLNNPKSGKQLLVRGELGIKQH